MLDAIHQHWLQFRCSVPGRRFQDWYWHRCRDRSGNPSRARRLLHRLAGALVLLAGVVMLATPGPGWAAIGLGAALLAGESLGFARILDKIELHLRRWAHRGLELWRRASPSSRALTLGLALAAAAGLAYLAYRLLIA